MLTRRILTILPVAVIVVLLQSAFWVPTYDRQDIGGDARLRTFITSSIGDAKFTNPIISTDAASLDIAALVYEGLLDIDENMEWQGALAEAWSTTSIATLALIDGRTLPDGSPATQESVLRILRGAEIPGNGSDPAAGPLGASLSSIRTLPPETVERIESITITDDEGKPASADLRITIALPTRVQFDLDRVVPDLEARLEALLGEALFAPVDLRSRIETDATDDELEALGERRDELFQVLRQNPVMLFQLRRDVTFHDGHPFDAGDVVFSYEAFVDPLTASPRASTWEPIESVTALDDHTVRVVYKRLFSPATIAWAGPSILPEHLMNRAALEREMDRRGITGEARERFGLRQSETARNPVGTGQYRFVEWQSDEYIHLQAYEDHWKKVPEYRDYYYRIIPERVTQEVEFRSGGVDAYEAPAYQIPRYREDPRYRFISAPQGYYAYIGYNTQRKPFEDIRVRKALGMAIDVDAIIEFVLYGEGDRVTGPYYITTPFYDPDTPELPYDPEGARKLLDEAGWVPGPDGIRVKDGKRLEFTIATNNGNPQRKAIVTIAQNAWKDIGVEVTTQLLEWTVFIEQYTALEFDAVVLAWAGGSLNPDLYQLWHSSQTGPGQMNRAGYANPEADSLIEEIRRTYDPDQQRKLARRLHSLIAADHPITFLYSARANLVLDRKIVRVETDEAGNETISRVEPATGGRIAYWFDHWRKVASPPYLEAEN